MRTICNSSNKLKSFYPRKGMGTPRRLLVVDYTSLVVHIDVELGQALSIISTSAP